MGKKGAKFSRRQKYVSAKLRGKAPFFLNINRKMYYIFYFNCSSGSKGNQGERRAEREREREKRKQEDEHFVKSSLTLLPLSIRFKMYDNI